jgi:thiol-disulfide isomerase/thioredoxin
MSLTFKSVTCFLLSAILLLCSQSALSFHDSTGRIFTSSEFKDKWVIVNYWADWCDSCIAEIPELNKFYKNNKDGNIVMVGVNYDRLPNPMLRQAIDKTGILFPVLQEDPAQLWQLGEISVLPTTFVISPDGVVAHKIIGPNTEQSLLKIVHNRVYGKKNNKEIKDSLG